MEVSSPPKFFSLHAPNRSGYDKSRFLSASSKLMLCNYKGHNGGRLTHKCGLSRSYNNLAPNSISSFPGRRTGTSRHDLNPAVDFNGQNDEYKLHRWNRLSTCVIARSALAGTGTPEAADQSPGLYEKLCDLFFLKYAFLFLTSGIFGGSDAPLSSKVRGVGFYTVSAVVAIVMIVVMLAIHPFVLLFDRHRRKAQHLCAKVWSTLSITPFFNTKFEGLENLPASDTPAVYVSNHQSFLDILTLLTLGKSFKFISKTSIFLIPAIGWAMFLMGTIPLKRMDSRSQLDCMKRCMHLLNKGASVFFFPEGTRSKDGKLGVFKKGAFSIAVKTRVPVVPITIIGTGKIMPTGKEGILNSGSVRVIIHKPIEGSDPEALCNEARKIIASSLDFQG